MNIKHLLYFADLICERIDLHVDGYVKKINALRRGDLEQVEFIEKMTLEPLDQQIHYLTNKALDLFKEEEKHE